MIRTQRRTFKIDKQFQPLPIDENNELYRNGIFEFNITQLLIFIKANPASFQSVEILVKSTRTFLPRTLNESTIQTANIAEPIILAEISPGRFNVVDGNHRLEKAYRDGIRNILAYNVLAEQHINFLTSMKAYQAYIKYWNSKVQEQY